MGYLVLFFLGFMLAIGLLAYASLQVVALDKRAEAFSKSLKERYAKPFTDLQEKKDKPSEHNSEEHSNKTETT